MVAPPPSSTAHLSLGINPPGPDKDGGANAPLTQYMGLDATQVAIPDATEDATLDGSPPPLERLSPHTLQLPQAHSVGPRYIAQGVLGRGGMGEVRLCRDVRIGRDVAVKIAHVNVTSQAELRARFLREALVQGQLEHPSIVPVHELEVFEDGSAYFAMKRIRGTTLAELITDAHRSSDEAERRAALRRMLSSLSSICLAVDFAHNKGVIHRDIKPGNIMVGDFGEVYLLDWGLAKIIGVDEVPCDGDATQTPDTVRIPTVSDDAATIPGSVLGTPGYMAPEQLHADADAVTTAADVFALGAVLFETIAGCRYIDAASPMEAIVKTLQGIEQRPSMRGSGSIQAFDDICMRALARDPAQRPSARAIHEAIDAFLTGETDRLRGQSRAQQLIVEAGKEDDSTEGRGRALRTLGSAIALDPDNARAREMLLRLLTEPPATTPAAVRTRIAADDAERTKALLHLRRRNNLVYVPFLLVLPFIGVSSVSAYAMFFTGIFAAMLLSTWLTRNGRTGDGGFVAVQAIHLTGVLVAAQLAGPLALIPPVLLGTCAQGQLHPKRRVRLAILLMHCGAFALAYALERLGLLGAGYSIQDGRIIVQPHLAQFTDLTIHFVFLASLAPFVSTSFLVDRVREELAAAEHKLHLYAWQLSQLAPSREMKSG